MALLFCGPAFPFFHPMILIPALGMTVISLVIIVRGLVRISRAENKAPFLNCGIALFLFFMLPYFFADIPVLSTFPFGFFAGIVPYVFAHLLFDDYADSAKFDLLVHIVGCTLNVIAVMHITDWVLKKIRREDPYDLERSSEEINMSRRYNFF